MIKKKESIYFCINYFLYFEIYTYIGVFRCSQILIKSLKSKPALNVVRAVSTGEQELRDMCVDLLATRVRNVGATFFLLLLKK